MAQLISIYNHPNYTFGKLKRSKRDEIREIWSNEDGINESNGVEAYDVNALDQRIRDREYEENYKY